MFKTHKTLSRYPNSTFPRMEELLNYHFHNTLHDHCKLRQPSVSDYDDCWMMVALIKVWNIPFSQEMQSRKYNSQSLSRFNKCIGLQ